VKTVESTPLDALPTTRRAVLEDLKEHGEASAEQLAQRLGVTPSAVRQHLGAMQADGLVERREVRNGPGRPRHVYRTGPAAEALFPKAYNALANELLDHAAAEDPQLVERLFDRRRRRRTEQARARVAGLPFPEQVAELARILDEDGYLASWEALPDGRFRIVEHNCAILDVARRYGDACVSEIEFLRRTLPDARIERVAHMMAGQHVCAYEVTPKEMRPRRGTAR
jgi:DeoR family suf operon transcriptional repressor